MICLTPKEITTVTSQIFIFAVIVLLFVVLLGKSASVLYGLLKADVPRVEITESNHDLPENYGCGPFDCTLR